MGETSVIWEFVGKTTLEGILTSDLENFLGILLADKRVPSIINYGYKKEVPKLILYFFEQWNQCQ